MIKVVTLLVFFCTYLLSYKCDLGSSSHRSRPNLELSYTSENFMIHYDASGSDAPVSLNENGNLIPDYIESVAEIAEQSRNMLVNVMGYREEPSDGDGFYDIYVQNYSNWGANFPESTNGESYIIIDNDYAENNFDSEYCISYLDKMRISVAHEYFHAIQRAYRPNYNLDHDFLLEMSSTWFERLMVDNCSDYLTFTESSAGIFKNPNQSFDGEDVSNGNQANFGYSMALFGHYLSRIVDSKGMTNEQDSDIVRKIWERYCYIEGSEDCSQNLSPRDAIIETIENAPFEDSFSRVWSDFMARNMLNGSYPYFNQDIYYHEDQQYINPPSVGITDAISEDEISEIDIALSPYSANIITLIALDDMIINSELSDNLDEFNGYYSLRGEIDTYSVIDNINFSFNANEMDTYSLVLTSKSGDSNVEFSFETTAVPDLDFSISKVYPNPVISSQNIVFKIETNLVIDFIDETILEIELYNILGQKIGSFNEHIQLSPGYNEISIPIRNYINSSGTYILKATINLEEHGYKNYSKKITVIK